MVKAIKTLTDKEVAVIERLHAVGYGAEAIKMRLKLNTWDVSAHMRRNNLKHSKEKSRHLVNTLFIILGKHPRLANDEDLKLIMSWDEDYLEKTFKME
jgi:hypothetical protein